MQVNAVQRVGSEQDETGPESAWTVQHQSQMQCNFTVKDGFSRCFLQCCHASSRDIKTNGDHTSFNACCNYGRVQLKPFKDLPSTVRSLFDRDGSGRTSGNKMNGWLLRISLVHEVHELKPQSVERRVFLFISFFYSENLRGVRKNVYVKNDYYDISIQIYNIIITALKYDSCVYMSVLFKICAMHL